MVLPYTAEQLKRYAASGTMTYKEYLEFANQVYHPYGDNRSFLCFVPSCFLTRELCLAVLCQDGNALRDVPMELRDRELCLVAVSRHGEALRDVPSEIRDMELCSVAIEECGYALWHTPRRYWSEDLIIKALHTAPGVMAMLSEEQKTINVCRYALRNDHSAQITYQYIPLALMGKLRESQW